jgi:hypothetical protein
VSAPAGAIGARVRAVDIARALAVIGVVFNHTVDGLVKAGIVSHEHPLYAVNTCLYVFRMPALAMLLGLFIPRAVEKRGYWAYLAQRGALMIYLYLLWTILEGLTEAATNGLRNGSRSVGSLLAVWHPIAHLWFLPFLVAATALVAAARPWITRPVPVAASVVLIGYTVLAWGWNPNVVGVRGLSLVGFVVVGSAIGAGRMGRLMTGKVATWSAVGGVSAVAFVLLLPLAPVAATLSSDAPVWTRLVSVAAAALGTCVLLTVAVVLGRARSGVGWLADIGRKTLPIYLAHVIASAGARVALQHLGVRDPLVYGSVCLLVGVGAPLLAARLAPRLHVAWLFELPRFLKDRLPAARQRTLAPSAAA